jgi:CheY-like chemotaxis protein
MNLPQTQKSDSPHILLVDDSEDNLLLMSMVLDEFGCTYRTAKNGEEALKIVKEEDFDYVLMDVYMPVMDGFMATNLIRSWEEMSGKRRSTIIGITGHAVQGDHERFVQAGMDDYIIKPFKLHQLQEKII